MRFTSYCSNSKTRILEKRIITKANKDFYKSKVTDIESEHLMPMVEGLLERRASGMWRKRSINN